MRDKKLQVFISSTYSDLRNERQAAVEAVLSSGNMPAGMELFSAGNESQMTVIERWIDESDVYLLILGGRYGSVEEKSGKSYTQLEFEYAISKNKPFFSVVISEKGLDDKVKILGKSALEDISNKELAQFRVTVLSKLVRFWDDIKDIKIAIHETLSEFSYDNKLIGWVRADKSINTSTMVEEVARLTRENSELRKLSVIEPSTGSLYSGLNYSELEKLLKAEKIKGGKTNLLSFLVTNGPKLANYGVTFETSDSELEREPFERLSVFKLVQEIGPTSNFQYRFTDDGHNFFLRILVNKTEKK